MTAISGLSESEVLARRQRGQGNDVEFATSRSYGDIIRHNVFNFINMVIISIGVVLVLLGRPRDAIFSAGLVVLNIAIGIFQEIRAKRKLDEIAVLTRPTVTVMRDGQEKEVDPAELVIGDIVVVRPGDQLVVDGVLIGESSIEVDESLLTGESDLIPKQAGDTLYSGSFCVTGTGLYETQKVGADCFANKLTATARQFQTSLTPLQREINFVIRLLVLVTAFFGLMILFSGLIYDIPLAQSTPVAAVVVGLIPNGLLLMIIVAYSLGAVRLAGQNALVQQTNAIESLSHVDVLCTDKTGTLTANKINYHDVYPVSFDKETLKARLADFASSASSTNKTSEAIIAGLGGQSRPVVDEVTFSSARKWSALSFNQADPDRPGQEAGPAGVYVLGALEMLQPYLPAEVDLSDRVQAWAEQGLRVLLFAYNPEVSQLHTNDGEPRLPQLTPIGLISFSDELRAQVQETIAGFQASGIKLKVISGDSPQTVAALAKRAGLPGDLKAMSGPELVEMSEGELAQVAEETTVFGRITPEQKEKLVEALHERDNYVAMIGDGVNDVLSLKKANVGIAMQSGSSAARGVADMILLNDSFQALVPAFSEGQRIVNGMADILRLFLSRTFSNALLFAGTAIMRVGFPSVPAHDFLYAMVTVTLPTFFLAIWAKPARPKQGVFREVLPFVVPVASLSLIFGLIVYTNIYFGVYQAILPIEISQEQLQQFETYKGYEFETPDSARREAAAMVARSGLSAFVNLAGILLLIFVAPPTAFFVANRPLSSDKRPALLAVGLLVFMIFVIAVEPLRTYFELVLLRPVDYLGIGLVVLVWMFLLRYAWRKHLFERFLALEYEPTIDNQ